MSDPDQEPLGEIFRKARKLDADKRAGFLDEACAGEPQLRAQVESLLANEERASEMLGHLPTDPETETLPPPLETPERIGSYRVLEVLGEGGMGIVYLVEQEEPLRRRVALKVIKPGMDSRRVLARFEAERQSLARMNHPNIAQIFDAGATPEGRPYFVMEHVRGVPLTEHCDRHKLTIEERLTLFARICSAVQHAHQKGIIHRDIKPSNILVSFGDDGAVPKIIDFGVARALDRPLTEQTVFTRRGTLIGTPAYMSPEQAEMTAQDIDTRTDIYSLGVLLYQLLTGTLPFDTATLRRASFDEMRRLIREVDPKKPSVRLVTASRTSEVDASVAGLRGLDGLQSLAHKIRDDLDWITMKCLEKDRSRRYPTSENVAEDVRRYLDNEPVGARPPSVTYRFRKWTRRHRGLVASVAIVSVVVIASAATATKLALDAAEDRGRAEEAETDRDRVIAKQLIQEARLLMYQYPDVARRKLEEARAGDPENVDAEVMMIYQRLHQGRSEEAISAGLDLLERHPESGEIAAMLSSLFRADDPERARRYEQLASQNLDDAQLNYYRALGEPDPEKAVPLLTRSLELNPWQFDALWQRAARLFPLEEYDRMLADAELLVKVGGERAMPWIMRGAALSAIRNRLEEAHDCFEKAIELDPTHWIGYYNRGWARYGLGRYEEALADLDRAAELDPANFKVARMQGIVQEKLKAWDDAIDSYERAISLGADRVDTSLKLGRALSAARRYEEAAAKFSDVIDDAEADDKSGHEALQNRAICYLYAQRLELARADFEVLREHDPQQPLPHYQLGRVALLEGNYERALEHFEEAATLDEADFWKIGPGIARWCLGEPAQAIESLEPVAALEEYEAVNLWLWELETLAGNESRAGGFLDAADTGAAEELIRLSTRVLKGERPASEVIAAAEAGGDDRAKLYAYYYGGSYALARGQSAEAERWFKKTLDLRMADELEHSLAACQLRALAQPSR